MFVKKQDLKQVIIMHYKNLYIHGSRIFPFQLFTKKSINQYVQLKKKPFKNACIWHLNKRLNKSQRHAAKTGQSYKQLFNIFSFQVKLVTGRTGLRSPRMNISTQNGRNKSERTPCSSLLTIDIQNDYISYIQFMCEMLSDAIYFCVLSASLINFFNNYILYHLILIILAKYFVVFWRCISFYIHNDVYNM